VWFDGRLELSHADFVAKVGRNELGRWPFVEGRSCFLLRSTPALPRWVKRVGFLSARETTLRFNT
jgi:hypothetical protein